jgi:hypothetical protein
MPEPAGPASAPTRGTPSPRGARTAVLAAAIALAALLAFAPAVRNDFINYDDDQNLIKNVHLQQGLTADSLRWAFTNLEFQNWHPLTWISHMLDFQLFGMQAGGHHAVSVAIHAGSAAVLFVVFNALTGALWRSALVAALFALHPLRVESVAWAVERKDVLSLFFGSLALGAYVRFARRRTAGAYAAVLLLFCCALMSKVMLVTLPALLLPAVGAAIDGIRSHRDFSRLARRSSEIGPVIANLGARIGNARTDEELEAHLREMEEIVALEGQEWFSVMRFVTIEPVP